MKFVNWAVVSVALALCACSKLTTSSSASAVDYQSLYPNFYAAFASKIDLSSPPNYASQAIPSYITKDNSGANRITNEAAILGRVLFYDRNLSSTNTVSCSSCHLQSRAFGDSLSTSAGVNGATARHAMRLSNARFGTETKFFWDERAATLEAQTTQPIQNHTEMGFSGANGDQGIADLIVKLKAIPYYTDLFKLAFGSSDITEARMQTALSSFVRSIQSFDSKYDRGRALANDNQNFSNFTTEENLGKLLFLNPPNGGGAGCAGCHRPPEFDILPSSLNNGITGTIGSAALDLTVTRSPSLRDVVDTSGVLNGNLMHDASLSSLDAVVEHYNSGIQLNANLDNRLKPGGTAQRLNLTTTQKAQLVAFLKTLSGTAVYTDSRWSSPF